MVLAIGGQLMKSRIVKEDFSGLNKFVKSVAGLSSYKVRVGIMGSESARMQASDKYGKYKGMKRRIPSKTQNSTTNATIGAAMEFGVVSKHIPARSWLRMPLNTLAQWIMKKSTQDMLFNLKAGETVLALKRLGISCENAIQAAFASRGLGQWAPNAASTIARKGSDAPLTDTAQLRRSVTSMVVTQ